MSAGRVKSHLQNADASASVSSSAEPEKILARESVQATPCNPKVSILLACFLIILVGIPKPSSRSANASARIPVLPRNISLFTPLMDDSENFVTEDAESQQYAGRECSEGYFTSSDMAFTQFCKYFAAQYPFPHFKPYKVFIGKAFVDDPSCYILDEKEFSKGWSIRVSFLNRFLHYVQYILEDMAYMEKLPYDAERFRFLSSKVYANDDTCHTVPFYTKHKLTIFNTDEYLIESDFILGRSRVYSDACIEHQWILGLYSERLKLCFYTRTNTAPLVSRECQVLCERSTSNDTKDVWYQTNPSNNK